MTGGLQDIAPQEVKYAVINAAASGTATVVAAVTGKSIRVLSYVACSGGNTTVEWFSDDGSGTALSGAMNLQGIDQITVAYSPDGQFQTVSGEALAVTVGGNIIRGHLSYIEI